MCEYNDVYLCCHQDHSVSGLCLAQGCYPSDLIGEMEPVQTFVISGKEKIYVILIPNTVKAS